MALLSILISARISTNSSYGEFKEIITLKIFIPHVFLFLLDKYHLIVPILFLNSGISFLLFLLPFVKKEVIVVSEQRKQVFPKGNQSIKWRKCI